jgi:hypothetical protein
MPLRQFEFEVECSVPTLRIDVAAGTSDEAIAWALSNLTLDDLLSAATWSVREVEVDDVRL